MEPLQLEESNDASDEAADLMRQAAASVAAELQPPTPYKSDQGLENDLINECQRLDFPPAESNKSRKDRMVELFGEDTNTLGETLQPVVTDADKPSTPIPPAIVLKKKTSKPRKSKAATNDGCARFQQYFRKEQLSNSMETANQSSASAPKSAHDENIIQELLASAGVKSSSTSVPSTSKRKRKSITDGSPASKKTRRSKTTDDQLASTSSSSIADSSLHSSRDEVDVMECDDNEVVQQSTASPKKKRGGSQATRQQPSRSNKSHSSKTSLATPSKNKTPVKLFNKSSMSPGGRQVTSQRQRTVSRHSIPPMITASKPPVERHENYPTEVAMDEEKAYEPVKEPTDQRAISEQIPSSSEPDVSSFNVTNDYGGQQEVAVEPPWKQIANNSPHLNVPENPPYTETRNVHNENSTAEIPIEAVIPSGLEDPRRPPPVCQGAPFEKILTLINVADWTAIVPSFFNNPETSSLTDAPADNLIPDDNPAFRAMTDFNQLKTPPVPATCESHSNRSSPQMQNYLKLSRYSKQQFSSSSSSPLVALSRNNLAQSQPPSPHPPHPTRELSTQNAVVLSTSGQTHVQEKARMAFKTVMSTNQKKLSLSKEVDLFSQYL